MAWDGRNNRCLGSMATPNLTHLDKNFCLSEWSYIVVRAHVSHWWVGGGGDQHKVQTHRVKLPLLFWSCCCTVRILWSCCHGDVGQSADVPEQPGSSVGNGEQTASAGKGNRLQQNIGQQDSPELSQLLTAKKTSKCWGWLGEMKKRAGEYHFHKDYWNKTSVLSDKSNSI